MPLSPQIESGDGLTETLADEEKQQERSTANTHLVPKTSNPIFIGDISVQVASRGWLNL